MGAYTYDSATHGLPIGAPRTIGKARTTARGDDAEGDSGSGRSSDAPLSVNVFGGGTQFARSSPSESEVGTPGRGMEALRNGTATARPRGRASSGSKSPTDLSETDSEQSNTGKGDGANKLVHKDLVTNLKAQARRHDSRTSLYRGVSLLRQTGKYHAQINVQRKQLHLGFFFSEEEAARAYDRAAIFKASVEGGTICTNMDINDYKDEIPTLQAMTQPELLQMLHEMKLKSNESSAPNSPRKGIKPRTSTNSKQMARENRLDRSNSGSIEHVIIKANSQEPPTSPRFDALNSAVGVVEREQQGTLSVVNVAASVTVQHTCPGVIDLHISKRRRTRIQPRQAPAAA